MIIQDQRNSPSFIYHYCSMESFSKIIENREIWVTPAVKMNDITEGSWITALLRRYAQENLSSTQKDLDFANAILEFIAINSYPLYMTCFSQNKDLLSQWRGYADAGKGISIGFKLNSFSIPIMDTNWISKFRHGKYYLCKVQYVDYNYIYPSIDDIFKRYKHTIDNLHNIAIQFINMRSILKNDSFSEEQEWRLAIEPQFFRKNDAHVWVSQIIPLENIKTRVTTKGLSKYLSYPILGENQPQIEEVVLGPLNQTTDEDLSFFLYKNKLPFVKIKRSRSTFCG